MVNCRFAFEFDPINEGVENADAGTYDIEYNYYSFDGKAMAPRVEDASSSGSHFDGSTEYVPTGASRVKNSVYYLRDTMRDQDLNTYVPPVPPPTPSDKTEVEKNPDGSITTTVTKPDGSQTITHETATGTESVVKKDEDGKVELPLADAESGSDVEKVSVVEVKVPASVSDKAPVQVTVPVAKDEGDELNYGIVVFAIDAEGNETVIPKCAVDDDGNVVFEATGDFTIKVVDNAKDMPDVEETDWFAGDVVDFAPAASSTASTCPTDLSSSKVTTTSPASRWPCSSCATPTTSAWTCRLAPRSTSRTPARSPTSPGTPCPGRSSRACSAATT